MQLTKSALLADLKKPFLGQGTLGIVINKYYTDVDGAVIAKGAAPAALQNSIPVFMLGNFDRIGARNIGLKTLNFDPSLVFLMTYVHGYNEPFLWNTGLNTVQDYFQKGDIIDVWTDSLSAPSGYVFIQQTVSYGALAAIINNSQTIQNDGKVGVMHVDKVALNVDQESQLSEAWQIVNFDNLGLFTSNIFNLSPFRPPFYKLTDFIELILSFTMTQYIGLNFLMLYASDKIQVNYKITKQ